MPTLKKRNGELENVSEPGSSDAVGTEADILARISRGEIKRGSLLDITDDEEDDEITSLQVTHGNDTLKNVLDSIDAALAGKQSQTLSQQIAGQSTVEGALTSLSSLVDSKVKIFDISNTSESSPYKIIEDQWSTLPYGYFICGVQTSVYYYMADVFRYSDSYGTVLMQGYNGTLGFRRKYEGAWGNIINVIPSSNSTALTLQNCTGQGTAYRNGNMVTVNLEITATTSGNIVINYLPDIYKTKTGNAIAFNSSGSKVVGYTENGVITIYGATSSTSYYIHFTAPAKNYT